MLDSDSSDAKLFLQQLASLQTLQKELDDTVTKEKASLAVMQQRLECGMFVVVVHQDSLTTVLTL
jgi:ATP/maltotriose-dependent transcriptional regulator MalT